MVPLKVIPLGTFSQNMSEIGSLVCAVRGGVPRFYGSSSYNLGYSVVVVLVVVEVVVTAVVVA